MRPVGLVLCLLACTDAPDPGSAFVGAEVCAKCHPGAAERWRDSHHDRAMQPADANSVLGDFDNATFTHANTTYTFTQKDDSFWLRVSDPNHDPAEFSIASTFGVAPLQQYLVPMSGGRLQALGVAWDARPADSGGQRWFSLYPEHPPQPGDATHWKGRAQTWNWACADCHSTGVVRGYESASDTYTTTGSEIDVACESCHGAGSTHVDWARGGAAANDTTYGLGVRFDPADPNAWVFAEDASIAHRIQRRDTDREIETCARCHSRRAALTSEWAPEQKLLDSHRPALIDEDLYFADGQIQDEVYVWGSFVQSRMYAAGVACSDCHDPHSLELNAEPDKVCASCHSVGRFAQTEHHFHKTNSPGASCVACHMPTRTYMGVDERHDHSFRVPRPDVSAKLGTPQPCASCHADQTAEWASDAIQNAHGKTRPAHFAETINAGRHDGLKASERLATLAASSTHAAIVRASALRLLRGRLEQKHLPIIEQSLKDPDGLVRLAALEAIAPLPEQLRTDLAAPHLSDATFAVRIEAVRRIADSPSGRKHPDWQKALDEYRASLDSFADQPETQMNLALLETALDNAREAERAYDRALELDPSFGPAYVNLANLWQTQGHPDAALELLDRAATTYPRNAEVLHALGLLRIRSGQRDTALELLARAAELEPRSAQYAYAWALGLHESGNTERALSVLESAHGQHLGNTQLLYALTTIARDDGDVEKAMRFATKLVEAAPDDPHASTLLLELTRSP